MSQVIPTSIWTKLDGYDLDIFHEAGQDLTVHIVDSAVVTAPIDAECKLRPIPGTFSIYHFRAPLTGLYVLGGLTGDIEIPMGVATQIEFNTDDVRTLS